MFISRNRSPALVYFTNNVVVSLRPITIKGHSHKLLQVHAVVGVLQDETDPLVSVMKLEKAPKESYADVGGLEQQIQEIKESVELPLTHPEYYEEMGIRPPKGVILYGAPGTGKIFGQPLLKRYLGGS